MGESSSVFDFLLKAGSWGGPLPVTPLSREGRELMKPGRGVTYPRASPSPPRCRHTSHADFSQGTFLWSPGGYGHAAEIRRAGMDRAYF